MRQTKEQFDPGSYGFHELLDRTCLIAEIFGEHIVEHPAAAHPKLAEQVAKLGADLFRLYQSAADLCQRPQDPLGEVRDTPTCQGYVVRYCGGPAESNYKGWGKSVGVFESAAMAEQEIERLCSTPKTRAKFRAKFGLPPTHPVDPWDFQFETAPLCLPLDQNTDYSRGGYGFCAPMPSQDYSHGLPHSLED